MVRRLSWSVACALQLPVCTSVAAGADAACDFNGTVIVEWLNVSGGAGASPDWIQMHTELIRSG